MVGLEVNVLPAAIEAARARDALVVARLNPRMPRTFGPSVRDDLWEEALALGLA